MGFNLGFKGLMLVSLGVASLYGNQKETVTGVNARSVGWPLLSHPWPTG